MSDIPRRARLARPFVAINGVDISRHVKLATVDRVDESIVVEFFGPRSYPQLEALAETTKLAALELRPYRRDRSRGNPAFILESALLYDWTDGKATFRNASATPMTRDRLT